MIGHKSVATIQKSLGVNSAKVRDALEEIRLTLKKSGQMCHPAHPSTHERSLGS